MQRAETSFDASAGRLGMGRKAKVDALLDDLDEAIQQGDRALALIKAVAVVQADENNVDGLWAVLNCSLPELRHNGAYRNDPSLAEAAKGWVLAKRIVAIDPSHKSAWIRGAILSTQHLGLTEEVLQWWEDYRVHHPTDTTPIIEQAALLIRMGKYGQASLRLATLLEPGIEELPRMQMMRVERMNRTVARYYELEKLDVFEAQNPDHAAWKDIDAMRNIKPANETFTFFMLAGPLVIWEAFALRMFMPSSWFGMVLAFILVYASVLLIKKLSLSMTEKRNRPVLDLWRAIEVEATSGKVCIPKPIRESKLYNHVLSKDYPIAFRERIEKIVDNDEEISRRWSMTLPEWRDIEIEEE